jgi:hydrogenase maturation protease
LKRPLILGLGNPFMGDDGAGPRVVELLSVDPEVTGCADAEWVGTDLLRAADRMESRRWVILVDALACDGLPGLISVVEGRLWEEGRQQAHWLSAAHALELLRAAMPALAHTRFTWVLIHVAAARTTAGLSAEVGAASAQAAVLIRGLVGSVEGAAKNRESTAGRG